MMVIEIHRYLSQKRQPSTINSIIICEQQCDLCTNRDTLLLVTILHSHTPFAECNPLSHKAYHSPAVFGIDIAELAPCGTPGSGISREDDEATIIFPVLFRDQNAKLAPELFLMCMKNWSVNADPAIVTRMSRVGSIVTPHNHCYLSCQRLMHYMPGIPRFRRLN